MLKLWHRLRSNKTGTVLGDTGRVFFFRVTLAIIVLASDVIIARALGPTGKGLFTILLITPILIASICGLGLDYGLNRVGHLQPERLSSLFASAIILALGTVSVVSLTVYNNFLGLLNLLYQGISSLSRIDKAISVLLISGEAIFALAIMYAITAGNPFVFTKARVIRRGIVFLGVSSVVLFIDMETRPLVLLFLTFYIVSSCIGTIYALHQGGYGFSAPTRHIRSLWTTAIEAFPGRIAERLQTRIDVVLLGVLGALHQVGLYSVSVGFAEILFFVSSSLGSVLFSRQLNINVESHLRPIRFMLPISIAVAVIMAGLGALAVYIFYGHAFLQSILFFWLLLPGTVAFSLVHTLTPTLLQLDGSKIISISQGSGLILQVIICILLIPIWGAFGAAIGTVLGYNLTLVMMSRALSKRVNRSLLELYALSEGDISNARQTVRQLRSKLLD